MMPSAVESASSSSASPSETALNALREEYHSLHFIPFTLNKKKCLMYVAEVVQTSDKEGGSSSVCDVIISAEAYLIGVRDEALTDKLYIKILKALKKRHGVDLDADYKLPKILKNYKGAEVAALRLSAYPQSAVVSSDAGVGKKSKKNGALTDSVPSTQTPSESKPAGDATPPPPPSEQTSPPQRSMSNSSSAGLSHEGSVRGSNTSVDGTERVSHPGQLPRMSIHSINAMNASIRESMSSVPTRRASLFEVNADWNKKWGQFLPPGKNVVYTSQIGKKNMLGVTKVRQLVLSDVPSLIYIDSTTMTEKGEVEWLPNAPPKAYSIDKSTFELAVAKRVFKFTDRDNNSATWVRKINEVAAAQVPSGK